LIAAARDFWLARGLSNSPAISVKPGNPVAIRPMAILGEPADRAARRLAGAPVGHDTFD
jgi:hypothetical protein